MGDLTGISTNSYGFDELADKYYNFYAPAFKVKVEGTDLLQEGMEISSVTVDTSVNKADSFSFVVNNAFDIVQKDFKWLSDYLEIGKEIQIEMGYTDKLETVLYGYITAVKIHLPLEEVPTVTVEGMDYSFKMMGGAKSRSWVEVKHSELVENIAGEYSLTTSVDSTNVTFAIVEQSRVSDYEFLCWLADKNHFELFVNGKTLCFRKPHSDTSDVVTLVWGKTLLSMDKHIDLADQLSSVIASGWDPATQETVREEAQTIDKLGFSRAGNHFLNSAGLTKTEHIYLQAKATDEVLSEAKAVLNRQGMKLVSGNAVSLGIPEIRAGRYVTLEGLGNTLNGLYYVPEATHTIDESGYTTAFSIGGNAI